jgi:hypothetical protein
MIWTWKQRLAAVGIVAFTAFDVALIVFMAWIISR